MSHECSVYKEVHLYTTSTPPYSHKPRVQSHPSRSITPPICTTCFPSVPIQLPEKPLMTDVRNHGRKHEYDAESTPPYDPVEDRVVVGVLVIEQPQRNVHSENTHHHDEHGERERGRGQQNIHLQQRVLLVIQHDVDVVLRVLHVLA